VVALACLQHEQECCARALQAGEQHQQAAAARAKAIADEANERHQQAKVQRLEDTLAKETRWRAALAKAKRIEDALAAEERQWTSLAEAEQEFAALMVLFQADMAKLAEALALNEVSRCHKAVWMAEAED
jgi:hypothetical protein